MAARTESLKFTLNDGATLAYDIFGSQHLGKGTRLPLVLIIGRGCLKSDWERLIPALSEKRAVLVYDHRGMGESTYSTPERNDEISIESMARDAVALVEHVGWKDVDMLGFSMGGIILQQLLLFPSHATHPAPLPFQIHHALLTSTLCTPNQRPLAPPPAEVDSAPQTPRQPLTMEERKAFVRPLVEACLSPAWVAHPENKARYETILEHVARGSRPARTVLKQLKAIHHTFHFRDDLARVPASTKVLVTHGRDDGVVPFAKAEELLAALPDGARMLEAGPGRGRVPSYEFGHVWYEYFAVEVWVGVIEAFVDDEGVV